MRDVRCRRRRWGGCLIRRAARRFGKSVRWRVHSELIGVELDVELIADLSTRIAHIATPRTSVISKMTVLSWEGRTGVVGLNGALDDACQANAARTSLHRSTSRSAETSRSSVQKTRHGHPRSQVADRDREQDRAGRGQAQKGKRSLGNTEPIRILPDKSRVLQPRSCQILFYFSFFERADPVIRALV